jgi:hypothetical protein
MVIEVLCSCGRRYQTGSEHAGKRTKCPACGSAVLVPQAAEEEGLVPLDADEKAMPEEEGLVPLDADEKATAHEDDLVPLDPGEKDAEEEGLVPLAPEERIPKRQAEEEEVGGAYGVGPAGTPAKADLAAAVYREIGCFKLSQGADEARCVAFSADSEQAFAAVGGTVYVLDPRKEEVLGRFKVHDTPITCLAVSLDGRLAISGEEERRSLCLWSLETGREITWLTGHDEPARTAAFSADGRLALSGGADGDVLLWDVVKERRLDRMEGTMPAGIRTVCFSPDGRLALAAGGEGQVRLWEVNSGRRIDRLPEASGEITAAVFTHDGRRVLAARSNPYSKSALAIWQWKVATGEHIPYAGELPEGRGGGETTAVALAPDGSRVLFARLSGKPTSLDDLPGRQTLLDPDSLLGPSGVLGGFVGAAIGAVLGGAIGMAILSAEGGAMLLGGLLGVVVGAGFGGVAGWILGGVLVNAARATASPAPKRKKKSSLQLWDIPSATRVLTFEADESPIRCLAISANGLLALTGAEDGSIRVWGLPPP